MTKTLDEGESHSRRRSIIVDKTWLRCTIGNTEYDYLRTSASLRYFPVWKMQFLSLSFHSDRNNCTDSATRHKHIGRRVASSYLFKIVAIVQTLRRSWRDTECFFVHYLKTFTSMFRRCSRLIEHWKIREDKKLRVRHVWNLYIKKTCKQQFTSLFRLFLITIPSFSRNCEWEKRSEILEIITKAEELTLVYYSWIS